MRDAQNCVNKNVHIKYGIATSQGLIKQFPMETFLADEEDPSDPEWDEAALCLCMVGEPLLILGSVQEESYCMSGMNAARAGYRQSRWQSAGTGRNG